MSRRRIDLGRVDAPPGPGDDRPHLTKQLVTLPEDTATDLPGQALTACVAP